MLKALFGKKSSKPNPEPGPQLCMVALKSEKGLTEERVCKAWAQLYPKLPALQIEKDEESGKKGEAKAEVLSFNTGTRNLMVAVMPAPIPAAEIEEACAMSWMWPEAKEKMKEQKVHAIVLCVPDNDPVGEAMSVACIAGAVAAAGDNVGIYWGNGGHVHKPKMFVDMLKTSLQNATLPVPLWVCVRVSGDSASGPFTLSTHGMEPFGHKELEILDSRRGLGDLRMLAMDTIGYLLSSGPVLKHGETFGRSAAERFKVEHTTSRFRRGEPVVRLHVP